MKKEEYIKIINKANVLIFEAESVLTNKNMPVELKEQLIKDLRKYIKDM